MSAPPRIHTFSLHYRTKYGEPVGKIPVDIGVPCPNRELGGCIYCRPESFTPGYLDQRMSLTEQIESGKTQLLKGRYHKYLAYFQQETCTALSADTLLTSIEPLLADPACIGLILSTRPDYVPETLLAPLSSLIERTGKECLFELGVQTSHEKSLQLLNRNHSYLQFTDTVARIKSLQTFEVGAHLIFGIPGETNGMMLETVQKICQLGIHALKLHHLQIIRDTPLEQLYHNGYVQPLSLDRYFEILLRVLPLIPQDVVIHRLWATSHPDILIAPKWNILATHLSRRLLELMETKGVFQGRKKQVRGER